MAKGNYHVSQDGVSRPCKAKTQDSCTAVGPDGEAAPHGQFSSPAEASRFAEAILEKTLGNNVTGGISRKKSSIEERVPDQKAFSTDPENYSNYRVVNGRLVGEEEGIEFDHGQLQEVSKSDFDKWANDTLGGSMEFQDGEVFATYDEDTDEIGAYARFGDKYYNTKNNDEGTIVPSKANYETAPGGFDSKADFINKMSAIHDDQGLLVNAEYEEDIEYYEGSEALLAVMSETRGGEETLNALNVYPDEGTAGFVNSSLSRAYRAYDLETNDRAGMTKQLAKDYTAVFSEMANKQLTTEDIMSVSSFDAKQQLITFDIAKLAQKN